MPTLCPGGASHNDLTMWESKKKERNRGPSQAPQEHGTELCP